MKCVCNQCNNCLRRKRYAEDPEYRAKQIQAAYKRKRERELKDPEFHQKQQEAKVRIDMKKYHSNSEWRAKRDKASMARTFIRNSRQKQATPNWVDKKALADFYNNKPKGYHVDHIVPIKGKNVCGLNVPWNLQYLPAKVNRKKSNKF